MKTHFRTIREISTAAGVAVSTVGRWTQLADFPKRVKFGWLKTPVLEYAARRMAEHSKRVTGEHCDLKRARLLLLNEKLQHEIATAKAQSEISVLESRQRHDLVISRIDHCAKLACFAGLIQNTLSFWIAAVKVECPDARLYQRAQDLRESALRQLREQCRLAAGQQPDKEA